MGREHERERKEEIDDDERNTKKNRFKSNGISPKNKTRPTQGHRSVYLFCEFCSTIKKTCASISWCFYKCASINVLL